MSDPQDILGKTDAFLDRYRGTFNASANAEFPVLTEVVDKSNITDDAAQNDDAIQPSMRLSGGTEDVSENRILQEVMRSLSPQINQILGDPLKERLEEHLKNSLQSLTDQVRMDIEALVRIAVSRAVEQVLSDKNNP